MTISLKLQLVTPTKHEETYDMVKYVLVMVCTLWVKLTTDPIVKECIFTIETNTKGA